MRDKRWLGFVVGAAFGVALVATCSSGGRYVPFNDGGPFTDGARFDVAGADATGGPPMMASCSQQAVFTETTNSYTQTQTTFYADVQLPGLDPTSAPFVSVVVCGYQCFGTSCQGNFCPQGVTCNTSGMVPRLDCAMASAQVANGRAVVACGFRVQTHYPAMPQNDSDIGSAYQQAYLRFQ